MVDFERLRRNTSATLDRNMIWNTIVNHPALMAAAQPNVIDVGAIPPIKSPALVLASGPSVEDVFPLLHNWPGIIIASPSQMRALDYWGRLPEFLVVEDNADSIAELLRGPVYTHTVMVTHQAASPTVLQQWKEPVRFYWRETEAGAFDLLRAAYPWIRTRFSALGSTPNTSLQLAMMLGCEPIVLAGFDYCHVDGQERMRDIICTGTMRYQVRERPSPFPEYRNAPWYTNPEMKHYRICTLALWKQYHPWFVSCSRGLMTEIPYREIGELMKQQPRLWPRLDADTIDSRVDAVTIPEGVYVSDGQLDIAAEGKPGWKLVGDKWEREK